MTLHELVCSQITRATFVFRGEGAQVAITGRDQKMLDQAVAELGPIARGYRADVTVAEDRKRLFAAPTKD